MGELKTPSERVFYHISAKDGRDTCGFTTPCRRPVSCLARNGLAWLRIHSFATVGTGSPNLQQQGFHLPGNPSLRAEPRGVGGFTMKAPDFHGSVRPPLRAKSG